LCNEVKILSFADLFFWHSYKNYFFEFANFVNVIYIFGVYNCFRFVYGREKNFESATFAIKVYKFSDEMQISTLTKELTDFLVETNTPSEVFSNFDLYAMSGNQLGCDSCKQAS
jgi:hypothetical protein